MIQHQTNKNCSLFTYFFYFKLLYAICLIQYVFFYFLLRINFLEQFHSQIYLNYCGPKKLRLRYLYFIEILN